MSYTASKISTTDSTESLVTALCKVSPVMGTPASKQWRIYTRDNSSSKLKHIVLNYCNTCGSYSYGRTPLAVAHAVACPDPKPVLCLCH